MLDKIGSWCYNSYKAETKTSSYRAMLAESRRFWCESVVTRCGYPFRAEMLNFYSRCFRDAALRQRA